MRNKFSELIRDGVASFNYTPITSSLPDEDLICRAYNNLFSLATDTHMSIAENGDRIITGHVIGTSDWERKYLWARNIGGYTFSKDFWSISGFLSSHCLEGRKEMFNGDMVYKLYKIEPQEIGPCPCPSCCKIGESNIPYKLAIITTTGADAFVQDCYKNTHNLHEIAENLNNSVYIKGNNWVAYDGKIGGLINNKVYML